MQWQPVAMQDNKRLNAHRGKEPSIESCSKTFIDLNAHLYREVGVYVYVKLKYKSHSIKFTLLKYMIQ